MGMDRPKVKFTDKVVFTAMFVVALVCFLLVLLTYPIRKLLEVITNASKGSV
jgi:hypothetical protein